MAYYVGSVMKKKLPDIEVKAVKPKSTVVHNTKVKIDAEGKAHSEYGASGSKKWMTCVGAIQMERGEPNVENEASKEGTAAHECLEFLLKNKDNIEAATKMANKKWNKEQVKHGLETVLEVVKLMKEWKTKDLYIETKVESSAFTKPGQFGSLDIGIASFQKRTLIIADYKYGAGIFVDVVNNPQLIYYALAMLLKLGWKRFDTIVLYVIQPRKADDNGDTIRSHTMTTKEILEWGKKFKTAVKKSEAPGAINNLKSGDHCQFCLAKIKCPELKDKALKQAQIDFMEDDTINLPVLAKQKDIGTMLQACEKLQMFINAVKERAYQDAKRGLPVTGYKLVEKKTTRSWKDEATASRVLTKKLGASAFSEPKLLSPAQIEKKFGKNKKAKEWIKDNVTNKTGGTTLAPVNSKKKAINIFEAEFTALED